jgi:hypothetical protein
MGVVTRDVEAAVLMIDFEPVRAGSGHFPVLYIVQVRQPGGEHHRGFLNREKHPCRGGIRDAPTRSARKIDLVMCAAVKADNMERGAVALISDTGGDRQLLPGHDRDTIRPRTHFENVPRFQAARIDGSQACGAAVGDQDHAVVCDNTGGFREPRQRCDMLAGVVLDDLDAVAAGVRHENAAALWIEGAVIERAARRAWYPDRRNRFHGHDHLDCFSLCNRHQV